MIVVEVVLHSKTLAVVYAQSAGPLLDVYFPAFWRMKVVEKRKGDVNRKRRVTLACAKTYSGLS